MSGANNYCILNIYKFTSYYINVFLRLADCDVENYAPDFFCCPRLHVINDSFGLGKPVCFSLP